MSSKGFTLIEALITSFVIGTVTVGIFGLFVLTLRTSNESERRIVAVALANEKMELVRNLPYQNVGTAGGVPSGNIPQSESILRNGVTYAVLTDIRYIDDPYDGEIPEGSQEEDRVTICHKPGTQAESTLEVSASALDAHLAHGDTTGACGSSGEGTEAGDEFNADYKQVRIEVRWNSQYDIKPVLLISYVAPAGIEGGDAGGTLDFLALNAAGQAVESATVNIVNTIVDPAIHITTQTNAEGRVVLPGLPESSGSYELSVAKNGYTAEQTYDQTTTFFPDADHSHLSMIAGAVTSKTFFIDLVSSLSIHTQDEDELIVPSIAYTLRGTKPIGTDDDENTLYLVDEAAATDVSGNHNHTGLVWDSYNLTIDGGTTGYDIKETSEVLPLQLDPAENVSLTVVLVPHTPLSLHVTVTDPNSAPLDNATVNLVGTGYNETRGTGIYGQVFFEDLPQTGEYTLDIDAPGYIPANQQIDIDGSERILIPLASSA